MQCKGIASLIPPIVLCLPSFAGAGALLVNGVLQRQMPEWGVASSVLVAAAVFLGWPLVLIAAIVSSLVGLNCRLPARIKRANYLIVVAAAIATFCLSFHFGR
jgi:hypothetical protein